MAHGGKNTSIYENSTTIATNLVRTSSLWLANMTLGPRRATVQLPAGSHDAAVLSPMPAAQRVHNMPLLEPERPSETYLVPPANASVDVRAQAFIERIHSKNKSFNGVSSDALPKNTTPPPQPMPKNITPPPQPKNVPRN